MIGRKELRNRLGQKAFYFSARTSMGPLLLFWIQSLGSEPSDAELNRHDFALRNARQPFLSSLIIPLILQICEDFKAVSE